MYRVAFVNYRSFLCATIFCFFAVVIAVTLPLTTGAQAPVTTVTIQGNSGSNGWFTSSVSAQFDVGTTASIPSSLKYQFNSQDVYTLPYPQAAGYPYNGSFELFGSGLPSGWGVSDFSYSFPSLSFSHLGNRSVGLVSYPDSEEYTYLTNKWSPVAVTPSDTIDVRVWGIAYMDSDALAYVEIVGLDSQKLNDHVIGYTNYISEPSSQWTKLESSLIVPADVSYVYVRLGVLSSESSVTYWDDVRILTSESREQKIVLPLIPDGVNTISYYSLDDLGRQEVLQQLLVRKDTRVPNPWKDITTTEGLCGGCFDTRLIIADSESGVLVSSAKYRYFTNQSSQLWSDWLPVTSVLEVGTGQQASDGETFPVQLSTGEVAFGDTTEGPFRVQFVVGDVAGAISVSPVYGLFNPWLSVSDNSSIYARGAISVYAPPDASLLTSVDVESGDAVNSFPSHGPYVDQYVHDLAESSQLDEVLTNYSTMKSTADTCGPELSVVDGMCRYTSNFTLTPESLGNQFLTVEHSNIILVEGDLTIQTNLSEVTNVSTMFIVEGNIYVSGIVTQISGMFISQGFFDSDSGQLATQPLTINGSVFSLTGLYFSRDQGAGGPGDNETIPSEVVIWQPKFLLNPVIINLVQGNTNDYQWREVE